MKNLLIDIGSTFIKYCILNTKNGEISDEGNVPFPNPSIDDGTRYIVPKSDIKNAVLKIFDTAKECKNAFISVQMHGYVLSGGDYVSWRDKSGDIGSGAFAEIDFDALGTAKKVNLPLVKLAFKDIEGEFFTLGSYVSYVLTGINATHITDAAASGFFYRDTCKENKCTDDKLWSCEPLGSIHILW